MRHFLRIAGAAALAVSLACGTTWAQAKPLRHLIYSVGVTFTTDETVHDSGMNGGPASGMAQNYAGQTDEGQIVVDVLQVQPDTGLVVQISEQARSRRDAAPTMCAVYGNGTVICDESKGDLNEEEMALLRVLGRGFVDHSLIDSKNHWQTTQKGPLENETNDYTIGSDRGGTLSITYQRVLKATGGQPFNATSTGWLTYDTKLSVPLSLKEDTITRRHIDQTRDDRTDQHITLTLTSDSMRTATQQ